MNNSDENMKIKIWKQMTDEKRRNGETGGDGDSVWCNGSNEKGKIVICDNPMLMSQGRGRKNGKYDPKPLEGINM